MKKRTEAQLAQAKIDDLVARIDLEINRQIELARRLNQAQVERMRLRNALRLAATRLDICLGRMRACHEKTGNHQLVDEVEMFVQQAQEALDVPGLGLEPRTT